MLPPIPHTDGMGGTGGIGLGGNGIRVTFSPAL